jgi:hypothetical protein
MRRRRATFLAFGGLVIVGIGAYWITRTGDSRPQPQPRATPVDAHQPALIYEKVETVIAIPHRPTIRRTGEIWFSTSTPSTYRELLTIPGASPLEVGQGPGRDPKVGPEERVYLYDREANTIYETGSFTAPPARPSSPTRLPTPRKAFRHLIAQPYVRTAATRRFEGHTVYVIHIQAPSSATVNASNQIVVRTTTTIETIYIDTATYRPLLVVSSAGGWDTSVRVLDYRTLPSTPADLRLTSLATTHPDAHVRTAPQPIKKLYDEAAQIGPGVNGLFALGPFG